MALIDAIHIVRLVAVGIDRCSCITQSADKGDVVVNVNIPIKGIKVVIDENGIRPTLISHFEGLNQPVVTSLTATTQCLFHQGISFLVQTNSLVDDVNHGQDFVPGLSMVKPVCHCSKALCWCQILQPTWILSAPNQSMELMGKVMLLGIIESIVCPTPIEIATTTFYGRPLRFVLTGDLIPKRVIRWNASSRFDVSSSCDISEKLVRVR